MALCSLDTILEINNQISFITAEGDKDVCLREMLIDCMRRLTEQ